MMDRRDPDYIPLYQCDTCGEILHKGDRYKVMSDNTIMCEKCLLDELNEVECNPRTQDEKAIRSVF